MDIKQLLEKMEEFAGEKVGQKPGDQWRGTDKGTPGKKLVGDSIIKDLSKGPTPKTKEQELAEEWATFSEENIGTHPKRPRRSSDRHLRGHEPQPRYKTIKADESAMGDKDIELQDYRSMSHKEFQTAYGMTKTEWINKNKSLVITNPGIKKGLGLDEAGNPAQQAAIAIAMKKSGKKPKNEGAAYKATNQHPASRDPVVAQVVKQMRPGLTGLDMGNEAFLYFAYELGKQRARDAWSDYLPAIRDEYEKGLNEDANTDNKLAKLLTRFINQNEGAGHAVAGDAIEYIKKIGHIEQFATSLDYFAVDLDEDLEEDGSVEARWMVKVSDDEGDHLKTYHRKFPSLSAAKKAYKNTPYATDFKYKPVKKDQVEEAIDSDIVQAMGQDPFNRAGYNPISNERDYLDKLSKLSNLARKPGLDQAMKDHITQRILDLNAEARKKGFTQVESRGHKILATKLKDVERAKKFASGELKIPTPQERQAQLAKQEPKKEKVDQIDEISQKLAGDYLDKVTKQQVSKHGIQPNMYGKLPKNRQKGVSNALNRLLVDPKEKVDEYGADQPTGTAGQSNLDPKQAQQVAANLNVQKTALNQLKQINPEIDPQKAATAMTKDLATMSPQEKEELAQIGKTVSPALGTPAFGSIKTAIQKSQIK